MTACASCRGTCRLTFDADQHEYRLDGKRLPSVTEILADVAAIDRTRYTPGSADRGRKVHLACQFFLEGDLDLDSLDPALAGYVRGLERFLQETGFQARLIEQRVHDGDSYAGTLDLVGLMTDELDLVDLKSGVVEPWCQLQTAAYAQALRSCRGLEVRKRFGLALRPNGQYGLSPAYPDADFELWRACLLVYHGKRNAWSPLPSPPAPIASVEAKPAPPAEEIAIEPDAPERRLILDQVLQILGKRWPGRSGDQRVGRMDALEVHFGTRDFTALEKLPLERLREGLFGLQDYVRSTSDVGTSA